MAIGKGELPELKPVKGFCLGSTSAGIRQAGRLDLVVMSLCEGARVASVFTRNAFCAAPVQVAKRHLGAELSSRYFLVNTGNANAGTGEAGVHDAERCCEALAKLTGVEVPQVLPFSTGVIGESLPVGKLLGALPTAIADLSESGWSAAATGIMTTDTRPKGASRQLEIDGREVTVTGMAKGAGMIKPNMATMLAYIATDARVDQNALQSMLDHALGQSFNRITVDGDTSTNDACMLVATGQAGVEGVEIAETDSAYQQLLSAVTEVCVELAQGLVRDAEGASKFVTVRVNGGADESECLKVAYTVAESPLVKTALFASDPNWGRILAAIGRAGIERMDVDRVSVAINGVLIAEGGCRASSYSEERGTSAMAEEEIEIAIELARGAHSACVWTSDLSHEYVRINAEYRT